MKRTGISSRAAAIAWFAPFPPSLSASVCAFLPLNAGAWSPGSFSSTAGPYRIGDVLIGVTVLDRGPPRTLRSGAVELR
ncbi:hypothetical protein [Actinomadura formosensis]|uniref:hypothetical protein n=1 Tax=Actinomadura formosensis TaxID=60706 RepID=UPI00082B18E2|nr:hypothetical protein [Actinomadura formosensis]